LERTRAAVRAMQESESVPVPDAESLLRSIKAQFLNAMERSNLLTPEARLLLQVLNTHEPWHLADVIVPHLALGPEERASLTTGTLAERLQKLGELLAEAKIALNREPPG